MTWTSDSPKWLYECRVCQMKHRKLSRIGKAHLKYKWSPRHSLVARMAR